MLLLRKEKISNTAEGEKKEASCLFPSLTLWNPEGGKDSPKRWFTKQWRKKEKNNGLIKTPYLDMCDNVFFLHYRWVAFHYFYHLKLLIPRNYKQRTESWKNFTFSSS